MILFPLLISALAPNLYLIFAFSNGLRAFAVSLDSHVRTW